MVPLKDITDRNINDFDFNLLRSLKVKCNDANGFPIYGLLLIFNTNI